MLTYEREEIGILMIILSKTWTGVQTRDMVNRRAGGRRRINAERQARAWRRRNIIKQMLGGNVALLVTRRGLSARLAAQFGVNRSTISRDKEALLIEWRKDHICPGCGVMQNVPLKVLARLARRGMDIGCPMLDCHLKKRRPGVERTAF